MNNSNSKSRIHYAWIVLIGCCALQGATIGIIMNTKGIFFAPVCEDLGFSLSSFTMQQVAAGVATLIVTPFVAKFYERFNLRLIMTIMLFVFVGCWALMGVCHNLISWYVLCFFQGVSSPFLTLLPVSLIIGNWFNKKRGTAIAISGACAGTMGALFNIIGANVINAFNWRIGYVFMAACCLIMALPATLFILRWSPKDKGLKKYGEEEGAKEKAAEEESITYSKPAYRIVIAMIVLAAVTIGLCGSFPVHMNKYAISLGMSIVNASKIASCCLVGNILAKLLLGPLSDKIGILKASYVGFTVVLCGAVGALIASPSQLTLLIISSVCLGFAMSMYSVEVPLIVYHIFGAKNVSKPLSYTSMAGSITGCFGSIVYSLLYDINDSYRACFFLLIGLVVFSWILLSIITSFTKKAKNTLN